MIEAIDPFLRTRLAAAADTAPYSRELLLDFLRLGPLHAFIPRDLGGSLDGAESYLRILERTAFHSVPLALTLGISGTLFLQPLCRHAPAAVRDPVIREFLTSPSLGGIMITEPTGGTDIFGLGSCYEVCGDQLVVEGTKCWAGLTGQAQHWLVAARRRQDGRLTRRVSLIYLPAATAGVEVERLFDALGLQPIPYGQTRYARAAVPASHLMPPGGHGGLRVIYDTLFRSRLAIPAIAAGLGERLVVEATARMAGRSSFGRALDQYDQVQYRLEGLRAMRDTNHCLWRFGATWTDGHPDLSTDYCLVNAAKVVASETMQGAADSAVQLFASAAYKRTHLVGRAFVDARPFQIFEGSNDVLDENTMEVLYGRHGRGDLDAVAAELGRYGLRLPGGLPETVSSALGGGPDQGQRQKVQLGRLVAWVFALAIVRATPLPEASDPVAAERLARRRIAELAAAVPYLG
ncbi:MAG: acyl-CoA dehydrogenase [Gemmatimonadota bacterium]